MLTAHIAIVSQTSLASHETVMDVAGAVQRQIERDFSPMWGVSATVEPMSRLDQVPAGYWPIVLRDDLPGPNVLGLHLDDNGQPLSLIQASNVWSLTASHEALEMLADPYGNRLIPGGSLRPGQGIADFLVEVADPVQSVANAYSVNGILVSDFVTPEYFQHPAPVAGASYSFTGAVQRPRDVADGGSVTWREPHSGHWWQATRASGQLEFTDLGIIQGGAVGLRRGVDTKSTPRELFYGVPPDSPYLDAAKERFASELSAASVQAHAWSRQIDRIVSTGPRSIVHPLPLYGIRPPSDKAALRRGGSKNSAPSGTKVTKSQRPTQ